MIRGAIVYYFEINKERIGGISKNGEGKIVEMEESYFFKSKYNRGVRLQGIWYVGDIERGTSKCFMVPVLNRNTETIR